MSFISNLKVIIFSVINKKFCWRDPSGIMVYKFEYDWRINTSEIRSDYPDKVSRLYSSKFSASPDRTKHDWRLCLTYDENEPDYYGIWINCMDKKMKKNVSVAFKYRIHLKWNKTVSGKSESFLFNGSGLGYGEFIKRRPRIGSRESIDRIFVEIEMSRWFKKKEPHYYLNTHIHHVSLFICGWYEGINLNNK